jgi:hypothetical protein
MARVAAIWIFEVGQPLAWLLLAAQDKERKWSF